MPPCVEEEGRTGMLRWEQAWSRPLLTFPIKSRLAAELYFAQHSTLLLPLRTLRFATLDCVTVERK